ATNGSRTIRIVAKIHGPQHSLPEVCRIMKCPQGRFERSYHVAPTSDLGRVPTPETALSHFFDLGVQRVQLTETLQGFPTRVQDFLPRQAMDQAGEYNAEVSAGRQTLRTGVRRPT